MEEKKEIKKKKKKRKPVNQVKYNLDKYEFSEIILSNSNHPEDSLKNYK